MNIIFLKPFALVLSLLTLSSVFAGEPDPIVASVNKAPIRLSYVYQHIEALSLGDQIDVREQLDRFTESVIQEEMLFQYALRQLDEDPAYRETIKTIMLTNLIEQQVKSRIDLSSRRIETYYQQHQNEFRGEHWRVHHIPLNNVKQCEELMPRITSLASFTELAREHSTDPVLASRGGDLGYLMRHHNLLGLGEGLFSLALNETHRIDNQDGCHLVRISEYVNLPMPTLDEARDRIQQILSRQQEVSLLNTLLENASRAIAVEHYTPSEIIQN